VHQLVIKRFQHLYLCHLLVLSSPTLMMHGHTDLKLEVNLFDRLQDVALQKSAIFIIVTETYLNCYCVCRHPQAFLTKLTNIMWKYPFPQSAEAKLQ